MKHLYKRMDVWMGGRVDEKKNRPYVHTFILPYLLLALLAACDSADPGEFATQYVVESYLIAGEPLPSMHLSRTTPINQTYDFTALALRDATVRLDLLRDDGSVEASYGFREAPDSLGVYFPDDLNAQAEPLRTYRLEVMVLGTNDRITATTVVPDTFRLVDATLTEAVYQSSEQLELTVTRSRSPGRDQNYYIFVTEAFDVRAEQLTPFAKAVFDHQIEDHNDDGGLTLEDLRVGGSPILNEENYDANPDGTLTIRYPWLAVIFYGPNRIFANAIDDNLYDYIRSQSIQQGGSTFSPGEIPNPLENVVGAHGVFGSYARISLDLFVLRPEEAACAVVGNEVVCGGE